MRNLLIILICLISCICAGQGLGMERIEVYQARYGDSHYDDTFDSGIHYSVYNCDEEQFCSTTTYIYDNDIVIIVMDAYDINLLEQTINYLDSSFVEISPFKWKDVKSKNKIELRIDKDYNQFVLFYTKL